MEILEKQTLELSNVLSFRGKVTQQELMEKSRELEKIIAQSGAKKNGGACTATFAVEQGPGGTLMDMELLIPLDRKISVPDGFTLKEKILLTNALMIRHLGNPSGMQATVNALTAYIAEHGLTPITPAYNLTVKDAATPLELDQVEIDVYVGISPNIL